MIAKREKLTRGPHATIRRSRSRRPHALPGRPVAATAHCRWPVVPRISRRPPWRLRRAFGRPISWMAGTRADSPHQCESDAHSLKRIFREHAGHDFMLPEQRIISANRRPTHEVKDACSKHHSLPLIIQPSPTERVSASVASVRSVKPVDAESRQLETVAAAGPSRFQQTRQFVGQRPCLTLPTRRIQLFLSTASPLVVQVGIASNSQSTQLSSQSPT